VPGYLKHVQGGLESVAARVVVVVVLVGVLLLALVLLVSLRPSSSDVASFYQRAIVAWR
jgi:hypothetical protein